MRATLTITFTLLLSAVFLLPAARIISVSLCEQVDNSGTIPINIRQQFSSDVAVIHALIELSELSTGTRIKGAWISVDAIEVPNYEIDASEATLNQAEATVHFSLSQPNNGWPAGNYKLEIYLNGRLSTMANFSIGGATGKSSGSKVAVSPAYPSQNQLATDQSGSFTGQYVLNTQGITLYLNMQQDARGQINGRLSSSVGMQYRLEGRVEDEVAMGTCSDNLGAVYFEAYFQENQLVFSMIEPDENNLPDYDQSQQLLFSRGTGGEIPAYPQTLPQPPQQPQPAGSGQEYLLQGNLCSWSGSSSGYGNSSYSSSTRVYFDGQGNFSYSSESSFSGDAGMAYGGNQGAGNGGTYRVMGNQVHLQFNDGTTGVAQINMQQDDGRITELMYEGTLYGAGLCE
jgi:hypothetical protein